MLNVAGLFDHAGVRRQGAVRWGTPVPLHDSGVYVISTSPQSEDTCGREVCPLDPEAVHALLAVRPEATVDGHTASFEMLAARLQSMWVPNQPTVYVGLAGTSVNARVGQFYSTLIGARGPHAGGWPVKMLRTNELWVHYGAAVEFSAAEHAMLTAFLASITTNEKQSLIDPGMPLPFANLMLPGGRRKRHGIAGVKAARNSGRAEPELRRIPKLTDNTTFASATFVEGTIRYTQNVTAADVSSGAARVPSNSKDIFPLGKGYIFVQIGAQNHRVMWDPRTGASRERSGVIRLGRDVLRALEAPRGPMGIEYTGNGYRIY